MYPTDCWGCGKPIHILQCTCGSAVLFDYPRPPWQEHECHSGIGGSGYSGWQAVDVLKSMGFPIYESVLNKIFPKASSKQRALKSASDDIKAVRPIRGVRRSLLAIARELHTETKRTEYLRALGNVGAKILNLPPGPLWQITLVNNGKRPNLSYTCILPARLGLPKTAKNQMVFAEIEGRVAGEHRIWLVTDIQVI
jgi:hypothetical protein